MPPYVITEYLVAENGIYLMCRRKQTLPPESERPQSLPPDVGTTPRVPETTGRIESPPASISPVSFCPEKIPSF